MAEYLAPGVYVEEFDSGAVPIEGVSTSTAGFVGATARGPLSVQLVTSWTEFARTYGGHLGTSKSFLTYAVEGFFTNGGKRAFIARVARADATAATNSTDLASGLEVSAIGPGAWGDQVRVSVARAANFSDANPLFRLTVAYHDEAPPPSSPPAAEKPPLFIEAFDNLTFDQRSSSNITTVVNAASQLIRIEGSTDAIDAPADKENGQFKAREFSLSGGSDGTASGSPPGDPMPERSDFLGRSVPQSDGTTVTTGLKGIEEVDEIAVLVVPDAHRPELALEGEVRDQCENLKYRFGVLAYPPGQTDPTQLDPLFDTNYAAVYTPWIRVYDDTVKRFVLVPPVGHVAGLYARVDNDRGVHKAPANEVLRGLMPKDEGTQKPLERIFAKGHQDILNPKGINVIRDFRSYGRGIRVWGARTMSSDGLWKYVSVRRLFIFVEASLDRGTQWVVFEPNDEPTWTRVIASISAFLTRVWKSGALTGSTEQEAFFVRCDRTTMTQDDIDNGRLVCLIGIAPVKPAEFVVLRITQKTATAQA